MNKPAYAAIQTHSPGKPVLIFVSSRRQTRITANDIITHAVADERPKQLLHMQDFELEDVLEDVKDPALQHTLQFGIGLHHAGLSQTDRWAPRGKKTPSASLELTAAAIALPITFLVVKLSFSSLSPPQGDRGGALRDLQDPGAGVHVYPGLGDELPDPPGDRQGNGVL